MMMVVMVIGQRGQRILPSHDAETRPDQGLEIGHVDNVRVLPQGEVDALEEGGRGAPVHSVIHLGGLVDLGEELVQAPDDGH